MSSISSSIDSGILIRRSLFFLILIALTMANLFTQFRGLNSPQGMEQAQIAREIARGNGFTTKMIRPVAYYQAERKAGGSYSLKAFPDTYHSPLNPLINAAVLKLVGGDDMAAWRMTSNEYVFPLDRVIATVATLFLLMSIGVSYLLISRIFDAKIAGVTAILMLFCQTFWDYGFSGLPQMLMLLLFSCALYFVYRAVEAASEGRIAMAPAIIAGIFFTLLALTHWLAVWIMVGYIIFAAIAFRPRGIVGISILALLIIPASLVMMRNYGITGHPLGTAFLTLYNGLGNGSEASVMRNIDLEAEPLVLDGLISKILSTTLVQATSIIQLLGGIIVAPLFFVALLHPFKRASIANFRWAILLMWVFAAIGLAFFGISKDTLDPNQIHLLFAPIMTAYGLALVSILWSRLEFVATTPMLRNLHHMVIIVICTLPFILTMPFKVRIGISLRDKGGLPNWPPYYAPALNGPDSGFYDGVTEKQVVFSDQPWAVAWYADRMSIWLPKKMDGLAKLESVAADQQTPSAGIVMSPSSYGSGSVMDVIAGYGDFAPMVLDGPVIEATRRRVGIIEAAPFFEEITKRYGERNPLGGSRLGFLMTFYSDRKLTFEKEKN